MAVRRNNFLSALDNVVVEGVVPEPGTCVVAAVSALWPRGIWLTAPNGLNQVSARNHPSNYRPAHGRRSVAHARLLPSP